jgi:hypothetical protein
MEVEVRKERSLRDSSRATICKDLNVKAEELGLGHSALSAITLLVTAKELKVAKMRAQTREKVSQGHR